MGYDLINESVFMFAGPEGPLSPLEINGSGFSKRHGGSEVHTDDGEERDRGRISELRGFEKVSGGSLYSSWKDDSGT